MQCLNCGEYLKGKKAKYCSDKCRMAYKRRQPEQSVRPEPEQTQAEQVTRTFPKTFKDATGREHPIDYEGRRQLRKQMVEWAKSDDPKRSRLGKLDLWYSQSHVDLCEYLGLDKTLEEFEAEGYYWPFWEREIAKWHKEHPPEIL